MAHIDRATLGTLGGEASVDSLEHDDDDAPKLVRRDTIRTDKKCFVSKHTREE